MGYGWGSKLKVQGMDSYPVNKCMYILGVKGAITFCNGIRQNFFPKCVEIFKIKRIAQKNLTSYFEL